MEGGADMMLEKNKKNKDKDNGEKSKKKRELLQEYFKD